MRFRLQSSLQVCGYRKPQRFRGPFGTTENRALTTSRSLARHGGQARDAVGPILKDTGLKPGPDKGEGGRDLMDGLSF